MINDIEIKISLSNASMKPDPIDKLTEVSANILQQLADSGPERMRFWVGFLSHIHPLLDDYLEGRLLSSPISDTIGEHIINVQADTQSVDLKNFMGDSDILQPYPIRNSIRNKLMPHQLKMVEDAYFGLNKKFALIMSTFFLSTDYNQWAIARTFAHSYYNTQDFLAFSMKGSLYDSQMAVLMKKFGERTNLMNQIYPIKESVVITNDALIMKVEGKTVATDLFGNKFIRMPSDVKATPLEPSKLGE